MTSPGSTLVRRRGDQLHGPLEQLRGPFDADVVAVLEGLVDRLRGVPHPGADRAGAVGQIDLQVEVAVAIRAQLLIGGEEDLVDRLLMAELVDITARHRRGVPRGAGRARDRSAAESIHSTPDPAPLQGGGRRKDEGGRLKDEGDGGQAPGNADKHWTHGAEAC